MGLVRQLTGSAEHHRILRVLRAQFLDSLVHWYKASVSDRAREG